MSPMTPFVEGGWPVWVVFALTLLGLGASVVAVIAGGSASRGALLALASVSLLFGVLIAAVGLAGWWMGRAQVDEALLLVEPAHAEAIRAQGYAEVVWALYCGLGGAALPLVSGAATLLRAILRQEGPRPGR